MGTEERMRPSGWESRGIVEHAVVSACSKGPICLPSGTIHKWIQSKQLRLPRDPIQ